MRAKNSCLEFSSCSCVFLVLTLMTVLSLISVHSLRSMSLPNDVSTFISKIFGLNERRRSSLEEWLISPGILHVTAVTEVTESDAFK